MNTNQIFDNILAISFRSAASPGGGDSLVVSKYAVFRRSVARSSNEASMLVFGGAVWEGELGALVSVISLFVH